MRLKRRLYLQVRHKSLVQNHFQIFDMKILIYFAAIFELLEIPSLFLLNFHILPYSNKTLWPCPKYPRGFLCSVHLFSAIFDNCLTPKLTKEEYFSTFRALSAFILKVKLIMRGTCLKVNSAAK